MTTPGQYKNNKAGTLHVVHTAKGLPLFGNTLSALKDPLGFLVSLKEDYDDVVKIKIGGKRYFVIQSPEVARHVLQENAKNYYKPGAAKMMKRFLGDGLATSNGDLWLKQRRLIQPAFHRKKIENLAKTIDEETSLLAKAWLKQPLADQKNINQEFLKLTLSNITKTMFGTDVKKNVDEIATIINKLLSFASSSITSLIKIPLSFPTPSNFRFHKANREFDTFIFSLIEQRKAENRESSSDLLDLLLNAYDDESKSYMTARQLRDEITTIFMAGHETTAQTLSWVFYQLALYPEVCRDIRAEAVAINTGVINMEAFQHLSYTKAVIEETMRLYPPVWIMARKSVADDEIDGFHIPAHSTILVNVYGMNHHQVYWNCPGTFDPSRFNNNKEQSHPFAYIPFGGGQRLCIGNLFAMMVMQTVVCGLVREFDFEIPPGFKAIAEPNVTLRAKGGIKLLVKPHSSVQKTKSYANT
ncbi:MAG: cytochrome P450 [Chitinophagaceae bacterium]